MKYVDVSSFHKKGDKTDQGNNLLICILPNISKIYEKLVCNHFCLYFNNFFSKVQGGFCDLNWDSLHVVRLNSYYKAWSYKKKKRKKIRTYKNTAIQEICLERSYS